jgi:Tol biopolymer transport system component
MKKIITVLLIFHLLLVQGYSQSSSTDSIITTISGGSWTPDGKEIYFNAMRFNMIRRVPVAKAIYKFTLSSGHASLFLKDAFEVAISPDGKKIAYVRRSEKGIGEIFIYDITTQIERPALIDTFHKGSPSWSPDGKKLVYTTTTNAEKGPRFANIDLWVVDLFTRKSKQITETSGFKNYNPVWATEGNKIVYYLEKGDNRDQIYLTDENGSFHSNLTADTSTHNYFPGWFGKQIIYTNHPNHVLLMDQDGGNKSIIVGTQFSTGGYDSKTGKILFITPATTVTPAQIKVFDVKTKTSSLLILKDDLLSKFEF